MVIYLYRFTLQVIIDVLVNGFFLLRYIHKIPENVRERRRFLRDTRRLTDLVEFVGDQRFDYLRDLLFGFLNFQSLFIVFLLRGGGDCSVWSDVLVLLCKKAGFKPRRFLLMDGLKIKTYHIITVIDLEDRIVFFNVNQILIAHSVEEVFNRFENEGLVAIERDSNGKLIPYNYKNLNVFKW